MGKKAPRRNAYFMFMIDFKKREESRGARFSSGLQDVTKLADEAWRNLPQEEKDRYKKLADEYNKSDERSQGWPGGSSRKKKAPISQPMQMLMIKEAKQRAEKKFIQNMVEKMTMNELLDYVFYLVHVNVFCKTTDEEFVPAEIAISKFSLRNGVTDVFHRIFNPGVTPLGYTYEIRSHSEKTHRIPVDFVKATKGYLGIYKGITDFLRQRDDSNGFFQLYTMFDEPFHNCSMSAVKYSLKRIWETCNMDDDDEDVPDTDEAYERTFKVLSLPILFFHLKNKCASTLDDNAAIYENTSKANTVLLSDKYEFNEELACQFHKEIDNVRYCSQSYTVRWAQVIREQCLKNFECDEEEEVELVDEEEERIKRERELAMKEEKYKPKVSAIKTEHEIKKEKYEDKVKNEKCDKNYVTKNEKDEIKVKKEKDEKNQIKKEKDEKGREIKKEKDEIRIKSEKDDSRSKPSHSRPIKLERDFDSRSRRDRDRDHRRYDDVRVKDERYDHHRRSDDVRVKKEREDRHRRFEEDVRIKKERDDRHRSSEIDGHGRVKTENDILKPEHLDIPIDIETERSDGRDSRFRDSRTSRELTRSDYDSTLKTEHLNIPCDFKTERYESRDYRSRDSRSSGELTRPDHYSVVKSERSDTAFEIKTERSDSWDSRSRGSRSSREPTRPDYDSILKTEHLNIPFDFKTERYESQDSRSRDSRSSREPTRPDHYSAVKTERSDIAFEIKTERTDNRDARSRDSRHSRETTRPDYDSILKTEHLDIPFDVKAERCESQDYRPRESLPRPIKVEKDSYADLPRPIKVEKDSSADLPRSIKVEKDSSTELPRPIKLEKDSHADIPRPIKVEKEPHVSEQRSSRPTQQGQSNNGFPMPMVIKIEKGESFNSSQDNFPMPMILKTEKLSERTQSVENSQRINEIKKEIRIKEEPSPSTCDITSKSRKRTKDSVDLIEEDRDAPRSNSTRIKLEQQSDTESISNFPLGNVRIKNEPPDSYSSHGMKHEELHIEPENLEDSKHSVPEPMECGDSCTETVVVKKELNIHEVKTEPEIKKEPTHQ